MCFPVGAGREAVAMSKVFYEVEQAALALAISVEELEEMLSTEELRVVRIGDRRRLVRVAEVEALLERVKSGRRLRTRREFRAATIEKALAQAASRLNAAPHLLTYKVLEEGGSWRPGTDGQRARIMVELPADETPDRQDATAGTAVSSSPAAGGASEGEKGAYYYAPGQVARLLGTDLHEINLWIYLKELAAVDINGCRWVPKSAVNGRLIRTSGPKLEVPPRPFFIVTPGEPESAEYSRLGAREVIAGERAAFSGTPQAEDRGVRGGNPEPPRGAAYREDAPVPRTTRRSVTLRRRRGRASRATDGTHDGSGRKPRITGRRSSSHPAIHVRRGPAR